MKQPMIKVLSCAVTLALWTAPISVQAQESFQEEFELLDLITCTSVISDYVELQRKVKRYMRHEAVEPDIRRYYYRIAEKLRAEEGLYGKPYVTAEVVQKPHSDVAGINVAFSLHQKRGEGEIRNLDFSRLSPLFKKGYLPFRDRASYMGVYTFGLRDFDDNSSPYIEPTVVFYTLKDFRVFYSFSGQVADRFDEIYETDNSDFMDFPAGFVKQRMVLSDVEIKADLKKIKFDKEREWAKTEGDGFVPPGVEDGLIRFASEDFQPSNSQIAPVKDETSFYSEFSFPHMRDGGMLSLEITIDHLTRTTETNVQGNMEFRQLELGDLFSLRTASLTFDGSPNTAILEAEITRAKPGAEDALGNEGGLTNDQKRFNLDDLNGTYNFSTEFFDGHIDGVPMKFHAPLSTPEGPPAQRFAVCNDSRVRVRGASDLEGEILGHLDSGDRVEILDRSDRTMIIDDMNSYWYQVRRVSDDLIGWSYGHFLELEE